MNQLNLKLIGNLKYLILHCPSYEQVSTGIHQGSVQTRLLPVYASVHVAHGVHKVGVRTVLVVRRVDVRNVHGGRGVRVGVLRI
jgi:hypothetical protein